MRKLLCVALIAALSIGCRRRHVVVRHASSSEHASAQRPHTFDLAAIDAWLAREVEEQRLPGLSVAIARDGAIVFAHGYGKRSLQSGAPVEATTAFAIGSVSKQFTCACALLLQREGKLSLEDPISKYYPSLTSSADVRLYDALTHVSGYHDYYPLDFTDARMLAPIDADELLQRYAGAPLDFPPRTRWSYSNTGFVLGARVVEKASGESFERLLNTRIFQPIGMTHASHEPEASRADLAQGYTSFAAGAPKPAPREAKGWLLGAGGIWASASDLAQWNLALMSNRILQSSELEQMTTPRTLQNGHSTDYGCGLGIRRRMHQTVWQHSGAVAGFLAFDAMLPESRSAVVVLANTESIDPHDLADHLLQLVLEDVARADVPKVDGPPPDVVAQQMIEALRSGSIDRARLGEELSRHLTDERLAQARAFLAPLGEPRVEVTSIGERGGMEVAWMKLHFRDRDVVAPLYRTPDGKIQEFLLVR